MKNRLILLLLALLGFSGCNEGGGYSEPCEYGTPTARFTIKGRVTDAAGTPIRGIRVNPHEAWPVYPQKPDAEPRYKDNLWKNDSPALTDEKGQFEVENDCFGFSDYRVSLQVDDVDGAENRGTFESREVVVTIGQKDRTGKESWVSEYLKQADDIVLTKTEG